MWLASIDEGFEGISRKKLFLGLNFHIDGRE
jgi:hypothetical protein